MCVFVVESVYLCCIVCVVVCVVCFKPVRQILSLCHIICFRIYLSVKVIVFVEESVFVSHSEPVSQSQFMYLLNSLSVKVSQEDGQ